MGWLQIVVIILALAGLLYHRAPLWLYTFTLGISLAIATYYGVLGWVLLPLWATLVAFAAVMHLSSVRIGLLSKPLFHLFCKRMPPMSETERAAIEAGDVWWDAQLVQGQPNWKVLLDFPQARLSDEEKQFINDKVKTLMQMTNDWEIVMEHQDLPPQIWTYLKDERFFGMAIPKEYGGLGFSSFAQSTIISILGTKSSSLAATTMVPNSLGPGELLQHYGTAHQKEYYLPRLARAQEIPCFALTGPEAGSDAGAIPDSGVICKGEWEGEQVVGIRLNWNKRYITLAPVATVMGLAFKLRDPEHLLSEKVDRGITLCLIPTNTTGVQIGRRHCATGVTFQNGPIQGKDVFVPLDTIIGGVDMIGQGWRMLMECLSSGRGISLPALSTAASQLAFRSTGNYARIRSQFGVCIGEFDGVQAQMATIAGNNYRIEATRQLTASAVDAKLKPAIITAISKYHMTEMARQAMTCAMDIHAGRAVMRGPVNYLTECNTAIPVMITVEGANILTRNLMIFGQGAIRCHPYVQKELAAIAQADKVKAVADFDKLFFAHIGYFISNGLRSVLAGLTAGYLCRSDDVPELSAYLRKMSWMSAGLAFATDFAMMTLGGALKRQERLSARLGDVLSQLYIASAVVKYFVEQGKPVSDLNPARWALKVSLYECQEAFYDFTRNFPSRVLGLVLRRLIFPFGKMFAPPRDTLDATLAMQMMQPSEYRDRLTSCYISKSEDQDALGLMERAVVKQVAAENALQSLKALIKTKQIDKSGTLTGQIQQAKDKTLLTEVEIALLEAYDEVRQMAIAVDDFAPEYFQAVRSTCESQSQPEMSIW